MNPIENFKFWCQKVLPLVYDNSLSYYEVLCKLSDKVNEIVNSQNGLNDSFTNLQNWINTQLETYSKEQLIEWKDDGTLSEIIASALNLQKVYPSLISAKNDPTLKLNDSFRTLGYYAINDGGGAEYVVINTGNTDEGIYVALQNSLIAKNVSIIKSGYIDLRWYGGKSDETFDSAPFLKKAIEYASFGGGNNEVIEIIGNFLLSTPIVTNSNIRLRGKNGVATNKDGFYQTEPLRSLNAPSSLKIGNITALKSNGWGLNNDPHYANISIENLYIYGENNEGTFLQSTSSGAPARPGWLKNCEFYNIDKVIQFESNSDQTEYESKYYTFSIRDCYIHNVNYAIYTHLNTAHFDLGGVAIRDSVVEEKAPILISGLYGSFIMDNVLYEHSGTIKVTSLLGFGGEVTIKNCYFEGTTGLDLESSLIKRSTLSIIDNYHNSDSGFSEITIKGFNINSLQFLNKCNLTECYIPEKYLKDLKLNQITNISTEIPNVGDFSGISPTKYKSATFPNPYIQYYRGKAINMHDIVQGGSITSSSVTPLAGLILYVFFHSDSKQFQDNHFEITCTNSIENHLSFMGHSDIIAKFTFSSIPSSISLTISNYTESGTGIAVSDCGLLSCTSSSVEMLYRYINQIAFIPEKI